MDGNQFISIHRRISNIEKDNKALSILVASLWMEKHNDLKNT